MLARMPHEQTALEQQIEATDRQIDALVYKHYGLTVEEFGLCRAGEEMNGGHGVLITPAVMPQLQEKDGQSRWQFQALRLWAKGR